MRELEICVETLQGCEAAASGGADRIELCAALDESGLTPSAGFQHLALATVQTPVHVLIRPRNGGFAYSDAEFRAMCFDVEEALARGAHGVVLGVLTQSGELDRPRMKELMRLAQGRPVTFHRAFDHVRNLPETLEMLIDLGCSRVLTSGGRPTVMQGLRMLEALAAQAAGRIRIAAGGGVTLVNAASLVNVQGLDLHASLRGKQPQVGDETDPLWKVEAVPRPISVDAVRQLSAIVHGPR